MQFVAKHQNVVGIYLVLILLHVVAWGLLMTIGAQFPFMVSLGVLAYVFGLRHAVDADHIAAIDNTTRKLMHEGKKPVGLGMYFSLGHSSVVFLLTIFVAVAVRAVERHLPGVEQIGTLLGTVVSATFLYLIAWLNFGVLRGILDVFHRMKTVTASGQSWSERELEALLLQRGLMNRLFRRVFRLIEHSWQMYFVGFLFGLGFETASEVALLGVSSSAASHGMPAGYVLVLPVLFAAGMSLIDTSDGVLMLYAYDWAFRYPVRKVYYNLIVTATSVMIAFVIGTVEWLQMIGTRLSLHGVVWKWIASLNFGVVGYVVIGVLVMSWVVAAVSYKLKKYDKSLRENVSAG